MMWSYLELYALKFNLFPHIKFNHTVTSCTKNHDYHDTGRWFVTGINTITGESWEDITDAVMVCNGHLALPNLPDLPGLKQFKGKVIHTKDYKCTVGYEDKNVVVIGIGNSAGDAAVELSTVTNQVGITSKDYIYIGRNGLETPLMCCIRNTNGPEACCVIEVAYFMSRSQYEI